MSFLTLNGWQIDTTKGGSRAPEIIGDSGRAFDGTMLRDRRVIKDRWQFETKELQANDANALIGMLLGMGDRWSFDAATMYSDKGLGLGVTAASFRWGESADGVASGIQSSVSAAILESKFGAGALSVDPATINLLPEATRRASSAAGFAVVVGGAVATDTSYYLPTPEAAPTSVKHTRNALTQGLVTNPAVAIAAATDYCTTVYVMTPDSGITVTVSIDDDVGNIDSAGFALTASVWRRCDLAGTSAGGSATATLRVTVTAGAAAGVIYTDGWQIEQQTYPTTWADGARAAADLRYSGSFLEGARGGTFAAWVRMPTTGPTAVDRYLVDILSGTGLSGNRSRIILLRPAAGSGLTAYAVDPDGNTTTLTYATVIWDDDWHHIALVYRKDGRTGIAYLLLYVDGVEVSSSSAIYYPIFGPGVIIAPGDNTTVARHLGAQSVMDEMLVLPYSAAAGQIAALAARTTALETFPALLAAGDAIETPAGVVVEGSVPSSKYNGLRLGGNWHHTARRVQFELEQQ